MQQQRFCPQSDGVLSRVAELPLTVTGELCEVAVQSCCTKHRHPRPVPLMMTSSRSMPSSPQPSSVAVPGRKRRFPDACEVHWDSGEWCWL